MTNLATENSALATLQIEQIQGPLGPKGDKGDPGPAGPQGPAGASAVYTVAPNDKLGGTAGAFKYLSGDQVTVKTLTAADIFDSGNLTVTGSLSAGSTSVGTLSFSSATSTGSLKVAGDLTVMGITAFTGSVTYTGGALLDTATTTGSFAAGGTFFVQGDNGHVGIGLSSPTSTLTVLQSGTATNAVTIRAVSTPGANLFQLEDSSGTFLSGFTGAGGLLVNIASTTALNIQNGSGTPVFTVNTISGVAGVASSTPVATFAIATTTDTTTGAAAAFYIDQRSSLGNSPTVPTAYIYASSTQPALQIAVPPGSSNAGNLVLLQGASAQNSNILQVNNASGSFLSGFTGSGGLLMNLASTTALELQDGAGASVFTVDTTDASSTVAGTFRVDRRSGGTEILFSVASSTQEIFTVKSDGTAAFTGDVTIGATAPTLSDTNIVGWGDSLTEQNNTGTSWPSQLSTALGNRYVDDEGVSGQTCSQIQTRMVAATDKSSWITVIWAGRNNTGSLISGNLKACIDTMVASLTTSRYLILGVINAEGEPSGSANYIDIAAFNALLAAAYPSNYIDIRAYLVSQYNAANAADVLDHTADIPPFTLRSKTNATGTLTAGIDSSTCSFGLTVTGGSLTNNTILQIDSELIYVTTSSGSNVTACTRGYASTSAASHSGGATVTFTDNVHLGTPGYTVVEGRVLAFITQWLQSGTTVPNQAEQRQLFATPYALGSVTPAPGFFTYSSLRGPSPYHTYINTVVPNQNLSIGIATNGVSSFSASAGAVFSGTSLVFSGGPATFSGGDLKNTAGNLYVTGAGASWGVVVGSVGSNSYIQSYISPGFTSTQNIGINPAGANVCIGCYQATVSGTGRLQANGDTIRAVSALRTPASSSEACNLGEFAADATYLYFCKATNTWVRMAWASF